MRTPRTTLARRQLLAGGLALGASGCGFILYPNRRGRSGGQVDIPVLIIDLLWLLPGLIPGAVCLIVDFTTGCIYRGGGRAETSSSPSPDASRVSTVDVVLDGDVVATGTVRPDRKAELAWVKQVDHSAVRERGQVFVRSGPALANAELRGLL